MAEAWATLESALQFSGELMHANHMLLSFSEPLSTPIITWLEKINYKTKFTTYSSESYHVKLKEKAELKIVLKSHKGKYQHLSKDKK